MDSTWLKNYLGISATDTSKNERIDLAVKWAYWFVENYIGKSIKLGNHTARFFWHKSSFELPVITFNSVVSIKYWDDEFSTLNTYSWDKKAFTDTGLVRTRDSIWGYTEIVYSFGWATDGFPDDLKSAFLSIASKYFKNSWEVAIGDMSSEWVDGDTTVFKYNTWDIEQADLLVLDKYRYNGFSA